jgi:hypothetical protein
MRARSFWYALAMVACASIFQQDAHAQECPRASTTTEPSIASQARTLEGQLVLHDGLRQWLELKLDKPQCGQSSIQLIQTKKSPSLAVFRGCRVRSRGAIDFSPTGYFSLDTFQDVQEIDAVGKCSQRVLSPDHSGSKPDKRIRAYRVDMHVNYRPGDHPIIFHVSSAGRELRPWQAYASYLLTGGFVLYGHCGDGFVVDKVFGTPEAKPEHFDDPRTPNDMASFDPETAAQSGKRDLNLGYTCIREP